MHHFTYKLWYATFWPKNSTIIPQALYSGLASCDFLLFPKFKLSLRGKRFESTETVKENSPYLHWFMKNVLKNE